MGTDEDYLDSLLKAAMESDHDRAKEPELDIKEPESKPAEAEKVDVSDAVESAAIVDDDPGRQLTPEEISAMFAMADADEPAGDVIEEVADEPVAQTEDIPPEVLGENMAGEELAIDLDGIGDLEELLGIKEVSSEKELHDVSKETEEQDDSEKQDETGESNPPDLEGQDLNDILELLKDEDGELAEINELLKKSDNNELVEDDDMLNLLEDIKDKQESDEKHAESEINTEISTETDGIEEKPKKKRWGRKKKEKQNKNIDIGNGEQTDDNIEGQNPEEGTDVSGELSEEKEDKAAQKGFWGKLFQALVEEEEEEETEPSEEESLKAEQKKEKKSAKKNKKEKGKNAPETNEEILEEMEAEDAAGKKGKKKKAPKPKKEKKAKKVKQPAEEENGKKLPKKMIIRIFILCFSIMFVIVLLSVFLPQLLSLREARRDFYNGDYAEAFEGLSGQKLNDSDTILLHKAEVLLQLQRKPQAYESYLLAGKNAEALNELLEGVAYYQENTERIAELGILEDAQYAYQGILVILQSQYSIDEQRALEIIAMDSVSYTYEVRSLSEGNDKTADETVQQVSEDETLEEPDSQDTALQNETLEDPLDEELE